MEEADPVEVVRAIVRKHSRVPVPCVRDADVLTRDLGFDSMAFLLLLSDLETHLGVAFPLERIDELRDISFRDLARLVVREGALRRTREEEPPAGGS